MSLFQKIKDFFRPPTEKELWERVKTFYLQQDSHVYLCFVLTEMYLKDLLSTQQYHKLNRRVDDYLECHSTLEGRLKMFGLPRAQRQQMRIGLINTFIQESSK